MPHNPGVNNNKAHFDGICDLANRLDGIKHIELEPYHSMGENKYTSLGLAVNSFGKITESEKESWLAAVKSGTEKGSKIRIGSKLYNADVTIRLSQDGGTTRRSFPTDLGNNTQRKSRQNLRFW